MKKVSKSPERPDLTSGFISRNQKWMERKSKKFEKMKKKADKKQMDQCTFKPKTHGKDFLLRQKHDKLKSKVSRSLSPQKIKISEKYDLSVMEEARLRIERQDDGLNNLADHASPNNYSPSVYKGGKDSREYEFYQNESMQDSQRNEHAKDEVVLNLSKSPSFQHQILDKYSKTISVTRGAVNKDLDVIKEGKDLDLRDAKR
jgi:hypothetical protein